MYYYVVQALFSVFLMVKFSVPAKGIADVLVLNLLFFALSRIAYRYQIENLRMKERAKGMKRGIAVDPMTGLLNRNGLERQSASQVIPAIKAHRRLSVMMIDIDDLKSYNSEYGTDQGDRLIKLVAETIRKVSMRTTDMVCRINGGRYVVVVTGVSEMEVVGLAEKIRSSIERLRIPVKIGRTSDVVSVSIGVASEVVRGEHGYADLCDEAEESLVQAKQQGKNAIVYGEQVYRRRNREVI